MLLSIVLLLVGLGLVVYGSDILVDGASSVARKIGISEFVIGIIIVGFGTSCPELVVSITGAIDGNSAVSLGNVTGSNVFNTSLAAFRKCAFRTACRPWHVNGRGPRSGRDSAKRVSSERHFLVALFILSFKSKSKWSDG